ncbi:hypothetical protein D3C76_671720 [compost metagenome]
MTWLIQLPISWLIRRSTKHDETVEFLQAHFPGSTFQFLDSLLDPRVFFKSLKQIRTLGFPSCILPQGSRGHTSDRFVCPNFDR